MSNNTGILIILCGLPSSGKSYFAKQLADHLSSIKRKLTVKILDVDRVRIELFGREFEPENEGFVRETAMMQVQAHLKKKVVVIVDDINYYNSMRHDFKKIADDLCLPFIILYISTPVDVCLKWNLKRDNCLEEHVITNVADKFDVPGQKYSWDTPFDIINIAENNLTEKIKYLSEKIQELVTKNPSLVVKSEKQILSIKQVIDNLTRMFISIYANTVLQSPSIDTKNDNKDTKPNFYQKVLHQAISLPQFQQIQLKFGTKINRINTLRRRYIENTQFDELVLKNENSEKEILHIIVDFVDYLLK